MTHHTPEIIATALEAHRVAGLINAYELHAQTGHTRFVVELSNGDRTGPITVNAAFALALGLRSAREAFDAAATAALPPPPPIMVLDVGPHDPRPDDDPEPGDTCKDCGRPVTWTGPSANDWEHAEEPLSHAVIEFTTPAALRQEQGMELWAYAERFGAVGARRYRIAAPAESIDDLLDTVTAVCGPVTVVSSTLREPTRITPQHS